MSDDVPILSREALASALDDLRIAGVTDRVTASSAEVLVLDHDAALRAEVVRLTEERDALRQVHTRTESGTPEAQGFALDEHGRAWFSLGRGAAIPLGASVVAQYGDREPVVLGRITAGVVEDQRVCFAISLGLGVQMEEPRSV